MFLIKNPEKDIKMEFERPHLYIVRNEEVQKPVEVVKKRDRFKTSAERRLRLEKQALEEALKTSQEQIENLKNKVIELSDARVADQTKIQGLIWQLNNQRDRTNLFFGIARIFERDLEAARARIENLNNALVTAKPSS